MSSPYRTAAVRPKPEPQVGQYWVGPDGHGMDGCWTDCTDAVTPEAALRVWFEKTEGGEKATSFNDIDYYRVFPAATQMYWSATTGREMFR